MIHRFFGRHHRGICWGTLGLIIVFFGIVRASDETEFYRAMRWQGMTELSGKPWLTMADIIYGTGSAHHAFNARGDKVGLFTAHGSTDMKLVAPIAPAGPLPENATETEKFSFAIRDLQLTGSQGNLDFGGHFHIHTLDVVLRQNIVWGLFVQAVIPFIQETVDRIFYNTEIPASQYTSNDQFNNFRHLIDSEFEGASLTKMLTENGINPLCTSTRRGTGFGAIRAYLGWSGRSEMEGVIERVEGFIKAGVAAPSGSRMRTNLIFDVPAGYDRHWGFSGRGQCEVGFWRFFGLGITLGSTVFLQESYPRRLKRLKEQRGWILIDEAPVQVDRGSVWDLGVYGKVGSEKRGYMGVIGYSYINQDPTYYTARPRDFGQIQPQFKDGTPIDNAIINTDFRLKGYIQHVLHILLWGSTAMFSDRPTSAHLAFHYDFPFAGKYCWATDMIGGTIGVVFGWKF